MNISYVYKQKTYFGMTPNISGAPGTKKGRLATGKISQAVSSIKNKYVVDGALSWLLNSCLKMSALNLFDGVVDGVVSWLLRISTGKKHENDGEGQGREGRPPRVYMRVHVWIWVGTPT